MFCRIYIGERLRFADSVLIVNRLFVATAPASRMWCVSNRFGVSPAPMVGRCYVAYHFPQRTHKNKAASLDATTSCVSTSPRVSRCATIEPQNTITSPRENVSRKSAVGFVTFSKSCVVRTKKALARTILVRRLSSTMKNAISYFPYLFYNLHIAFFLISLCTLCVECLHRCIYV